MNEAAAERDLALALLENARQEFLAKAREVARRICRERGVVTTDDIRSEIVVPSNIDPRVMGAVLKNREFEPSGYVQSQRRECHNRPIRTFKFRRVEA